MSPITTPSDLAATPNLNRSIAAPGSARVETPPAPRLGTRRILLAKVGLDGHDRGIKVIARGLRDAGFHVIYAGIWQSPEAVAQAVADEDADWLGISLLNGAQMALIPRVLDQLRAHQVSDVGVLLGGIIPPADVLALKQLGVIECFGPGSRLDEISRTLLHRDAPPEFDGPSALAQCARQDRRALSKLLTHLSAGENTDPIRSALEKYPATTLRQHPGPRIIALTGSPGVGKSSLIARLLTELRATNQTVAVLSCDPQSPITGGALLGDRIRMAGLLPDPGVLIRSLATPSGSQGVAGEMDLMIQVLALYGFDVILVETVGTGQGDVAIRQYAQTVVAMLQPESGDSIQWEKAGLLEIADLIVIHKFDLPGADRLAAQLRRHLNLPGYRVVPLVPVSTADGTGLARFMDLLHLMSPGGSDHARPTDQT